MNIRNFLQWLAFTSALSLISPHAMTEERVVRGKVVKVVPITETQTTQQTRTNCNHRKPATNSGLGALLGWDLLHDCDMMSATKVVTGYQVFYQWDDRTYSRTMSQHPGATVRLLLSVD